MTQEQSKTGESRARIRIATSRRARGRRQRHPPASGAAEDGTTESHRRMV